MLRALGGFVVVCAGCGADAGHPAFHARSDAAWVAFDVTSEHHASDILTSFRLRAKTYGCTIDRLCEGGFKKHCYGVTAYCFDKTIAVVAKASGVFSVGCLKPLDAGACNALLTRIMEE